jgi:hypothetical protein
MFFEEHPWLLVVVIIATVEAWAVTKRLVHAAWQRQRTRMLRS